MAFAGGVMALPTWASASSTNSVVHHAAGNVAGEVWFNSGFSAGHDGKPRFGENSFTIRDKLCADGWGIGVWWKYNGQEHVHKLQRDCRPGEDLEETFQIAPTDQPSVRFEWKAFKWDTNNKSATTYEVPQQDWMGADKKCNSKWIGRAATYGYVAAKLGYTFEVSMWPTIPARAAGIFDSIWSDLQHCVTLPPLSQNELNSIKAQLACHIAYAKLPIAKDGGPTWDFEARRKAISTFEALRRINKACNW
jgi:hypothetical protein